MDDNLYTLLNGLPRVNLIHIMWEALDLMEQYNGRTKTFCIATAIGARQTGGDTHGSTRWAMPTLKEVKRHTKENPLW